MTHDLVIRDGTLVDGAGLPPYRADVAVDAGRITKVGTVREQGRKEIDAEGHVVTPGFVDGHTHMDAQLFWDPLGTSSCWHGVTTVVMGNCGFTLAPARADARALVVRNLERAEDIDPGALAAGIDWQWETFAEYLDAVDRQPKGINYAAQIGHSALRTWAMGERAFEQEASDDDLALMERELRDAMQAGAVGFTTSRIDQHETSDDRPVASRLASWDEVCRLVGVLSDLGTGIFEIAPQFNRGMDPTERAAVSDAMGALAVTSRVPMTFGVGAGSRLEQMMQLVDTTAAAGGRMFGQTHSRGISVVLSFLSRMPFDGLPVWNEVRALPPHEQLAALRDESLRRKLVDEANHGDYGRAIGAEAPRPDYTRMRVYDHPVPPNPTVAEVAAARDMDPVELIIDLAIASDLRQLFIQPITSAEDDDLLAAMKHPRYGDDVLRRGRARQSDLGRLDPDAPARVLGTPARGVHPRRGGPHDHTRASHRLGPRRPWPRARGIRRRPERLRSRRRRPRTAHRATRPPGRRATTGAESRRLPRHRRGRRSSTRGWSAHRRAPGLFAPGCGGVVR